MARHLTRDSAGLVSDARSARSARERLLRQSMSAGAQRSDDPRDVPDIPGNPYRGSDAPSRAYEHLHDYHGISLGAATDRLHRIKQRSGLSPMASVVIGRTGDVYDEMNGEYLGSLTDPAA